MRQFYVTKRDLHKSVFCTLSRYERSLNLLVKKSSTFIEVEGQNDVPIKVSLIEDEGYNHCEQLILLEFGGPTRKSVRSLVEDEVKGRGVINSKGRLRQAAICLIQISRQAMIEVTKSSTFIEDKDIDECHKRVEGRGMPRGGHLLTLWK